VKNNFLIWVLKYNYIFQNVFVATAVAFPLTVFIAVAPTVAVGAVADAVGCNDLFLKD
jgi:hypothetical protein